MKRKTAVAIALALALVAGSSSATFALVSRPGSSTETDSLRDAIAPIDQVDECKRRRCN